MNERKIRTTTQEIARHWRTGRAASNSSGQFWTDGKNLFSYHLLIGATVQGRKIMFDYTASGVYKSQTTSKHVGYGKRVCDEVRQPPTEGDIEYKVVLVQRT